MRLALLVFLGAIALAGCSSSGEVSESDQEKMKKEFSQENYEKAMIAAGRGKELEDEKKRNAQSMQGQQ
jgi:uncharacterized protein YcfL